MSETAIWEGGHDYGDYGTLSRNPGKKGIFRKLLGKTPHRLRGRVHQPSKLSSRAKKETNRRNRRDNSCESPVRRINTKGLVVCKCRQQALSAASANSEADGFFPHTQLIFETFQFSLAEKFFPGTFENPHTVLFPVLQTTKRYTQIVRILPLCHMQSLSPLLDLLSLVVIKESIILIQ